MAHNTRIRAPGAWAFATVVDPAEFEAIDQAQFESINGDDGGTWDPAAFVSVGGAGFEFRGANHSIANGGVVTVASGGYITVVDGGIVSLVGDGASLNYAIVTSAGAGVKIEGAPAAHGKLYMGANSDADFHLNSTATWMSGSTATFQNGSVATIENGGILNIDSGGSVTVDSGGSVAIADGGTITCTGDAGSSNYALLFGDGAGAQFVGGAACHSLLNLFGYVDVEWKNHATAEFESGSTLTMAAGSTATLSGTNTVDGATTLAAGSAPALQDRMTLSGAGQIVSRSLRVVTDADFTMNTQQYDHYWVDNGTLSAPRVWTLPSLDGTTAPHGALLYVSTEETTHTVTVHSTVGIAENWVMQKATGQICGLIFISRWNGATQLWHPLAKYVEP